jgi:hypothetical protein
MLHPNNSCVEYAFEYVQGKISKIAHSTCSFQSTFLLQRRFRYSSFVHRLRRCVYSRPIVSPVRKILDVPVI